MPAAIASRAAALLVQAFALKQRWHRICCAEPARLATTTGQCCAPQNTAAPAHLVCGHKSRDRHGLLQQCLELAIRVAIHGTHDELVLGVGLQPVVERRLLRLRCCRRTCSMRKQAEAR
jgi:hypothetical protein